MEKETVNLPDIVDVLGERAGGMNETMTEYLTELRQRKDDAATMAQDVEAEIGEDESQPEADDESKASEEDKSEDKDEKKEEK